MAGSSPAMTVERGRDMRKLSLFAAALLLLRAAARAESTIAMTSFGGITNLPFWVAQDKGYFKGQGLTVSFAQTRSSTDQMRDMMADKYQIASTSLDNVIAYTEGQSD